MAKQRIEVFKALRALTFLYFCVVPKLSFAAGFSHAITLYEPAKYMADFTHFAYVNKDAPKRGNIKLAESGTFDSLNAFILKGVKAPGLAMTYETLMVQSQDEPQSYYGLIAQSANIAADGKSVNFKLRENAKWHDGKKISPDDIIFSLAMLKTKGDPTYALLFNDIEKIEKISEHEVKFYFVTGTNRETPFIAAQMPIIPKHYWEEKDFEKTTLQAPLASGPYKIKLVEAGRTIIYERVKNYWAKDLPVNRGQYNFDEIRYDMYRDENVSLEAFKAGDYDFRQEYVARNWATAYESPALKLGKFIKRKVEHSIPQGMQAFIFNTRKQQFSDRRVREAIALSMDFEWLNKNLFFDAYSRNKSFFQATPFAAYGVVDENERNLLEPHRASLPNALFEQEFKLPVNDGTGNSRTNLLKAQALLNEAGWRVKDGVRVHPETGKPLEIEFMLRQPTMERVLGSIRKNLDRLGIKTRIRMVDDAQYQKRTDSFDFDIVSIWINQGVFYPGNEQMLLWHSSQADIRGSNNLSGLKHPAVDAALAALIGAKNIKELKTAGRALDRVLLWEWAVIPNWHSQNFRIAYWDKFGIPKISPKYSIGFQTWWVK